MVHWFQQNTNVVEKKIGWFQQKKKTTVAKFGAASSNKKPRRISSRLQLPRRPVPAPPVAPRRGRSSLSCRLQLAASMVVALRRASCSSPPKWIHPNARSRHDLGHRPSTADTPEQGRSPGHRRGVGTACAQQHAPRPTPPSRHDPAHRPRSQQHESLSSWSLRLWVGGGAAVGVGCRRPTAGGR